MDAKDDPSTPSGAYTRMAPGWDMIDAILGGAEAVRAAGKKYLPKYEDEDENEYKRRLETAPWRPEFADALRTLASKPFGKDVDLQGSASATVKDFAEDVDQRGNNLTVFAREMLSGGIARGMAGLLVEWPKTDAVQTLQDERAVGAKPYWVNICADDIIALYVVMREGKERVAHVRIKECVVERDGFSEVEKHRVRVLQLNEFGLPEWQLWEEQKDATTQEPVYILIDGGLIKNQTDVPLVLYWTGERDGDQYVKPPLIDLAYMQIELYQALSRQEEILTFAGAPMLSASGLAAPTNGEKISTGPRRILFAPSVGESRLPSWTYIQPDAANLAELRSQVQAITDDMRRLGMQPMTQRVGGVTATATAVEGDKAHTVIQFWALSLSDALEEAFEFTQKWLGDTSAFDVIVDTDFDIADQTAPVATVIANIEKQNIISKLTAREAIERLGYFGPQYDGSKEDQRLAEQQQGLDVNGMSEPATDPVTGQPIVEPAANQGQQQAA